MTHAEESILTPANLAKRRGNLKTKEIMYYLQCILFDNFTVYKVDTDFVGINI